MRNPVSPRHLALSVCAAATVATSLARELPAQAQSAQVLHGRVVDSASSQPIPGAVIQALGADGSVRTRALSDGQGAFVLRLLDTLTVQFRVQRIGFRPRVLARSAGATSPWVIGLNRLPAFLDPVRVVAAQCRRRGRSSPSGLIEQARAGLLASVVARDVNPAAMTRVTYERRYDRSGRTIASQRVRMDSSADSRTSFTAVSDAAGFVRRGFLLDGPDGSTYFAPDAETLLDDAFSAGYCFRVMPADRRRPTQVGLGFEASDRQVGRVDVNGALWIDTSAREIREIEFEYEGLPRAVQMQRPSGRIEFASLANGVTIVSRWQLNPVGVVLDTIRSARAGPPQVFGSVYRYETGGELARARWRDGTEWRAPLGKLRARATWTDGSPATGLLYALRNTPYRAVSDSLGVVELGDLLPGTYEVLIVDDALLEVGLSISTGVTLTTARDSVTLRLPGMTADDYVTSRCRDNERYNPEIDRTFLLARALWDDGRPVQDARWSVRIFDADGETPIEVDVTSGSDGVIAVCQNLIRDADIEVLVATPSALGPAVRRRLSNTTTVVPVIFTRP